MSFYAAVTCPGCGTITHVHVMTDEDIKFKCPSCGMELEYVIPEPETEPPSEIDNTSIDKEIISSNTEKPAKKKKYNKQKGQD